MWDVCNLGSGVNVENVYLSNHPGVSNVTNEYNPPIVTILHLHHPLRSGKKHQLKEYDCYGNELSPSLLEMSK